MREKGKIAASIMCSGFDQVMDYVHEFERNNIEFLHVDVMDGTFVPNLAYGPDFVKQMNGIFAFGIMDPVKDCLVLFRDRLGVKPLFYTCFHDQVIFSSEIKGLFAYPGVTPKLDKKGLNEIFSIGPAKTYGCGVFKDIEELLPAHYLVCNASGLHAECYWKLESRPHEDS